MFEIRISLLQREKQTKLNSQIWAKSDGFREIFFAVERFFVFYCFCQYINKVNKENHDWQKVVMNFANILVKFYA